MNKIGWIPKTTLPEGIRETVRWFIENQSSIREK